MKKTKTSAAITASLLISALIVYAFLNLGRWLIVNDPLPDKVDLIFAFSGEWIRGRYAFSLAGKYDKALVIIDNKNKEKYAPYIEQYHIDLDRIIFLEPPPNTWEEVRFLREWLKGASDDPSKKGNYEDIALVSSPYHMRRVQLTTLLLMDGGDRYRFHYLPLPVDQYPPSCRDYNRWYKNPILRKIVLREFTSIIYWPVRNLL